MVTGPVSRAGTSPVSPECLVLTEAVKPAKAAGSGREVQAPTGKRLLLVADETVGASVGVIVTLVSTRSTHTKFMSSQ